MQITNEMLVSLGADPKVYSAAEKDKMGIYADKIKNGELTSLLKEKALPDGRIDELRKTYGGYMADMMAKVEAVAKNAQHIADLTARKDSIFAQSMTSEEQLSMLDSCSYTIVRITELCRDGMTSVNLAFDGIAGLRELEAQYSTTLADLGMMNIAAQAVECDADEIMEHIVSAFDKLSELTAFINDLKDKAVICRTAFEKSFSAPLDAISEQLDLEHDGKNMSLSGISDEVAKIRHAAEDVLHSRI